MAFIKRCLIRRTHSDRALQSSAQPCSVTHFDRVAKSIFLLISEEGVLRLGMHGNTVRRQSQIFNGHGAARDINLDARVHDARRIPNRFHCGKCVADRLTKVTQLQRGARSSRSVLAAQGTTVAHHQVGHFFADLQYAFTIAYIGERKHRANVQATNAGMRVETGVRAVPRKNRLEFLDKSRQLGRVHRGVLYKSKRPAQALHSMQERFAGFAQTPCFSHALCVRVLLHRLIWKSLAQRAEFAFYLGERLPEILHIHHRTQRNTFRARHEFHILGVLTVTAGNVNDDIVNHLNRRRLSGQHRVQRRKRRINRLEAHDGKALCLWCRYQLHFCTNNRAQRSL